MEDKKVSKKALKALINNALRDALGRLELPHANKKIKKLAKNSAKELAAEYSRIIRKKEKKTKASMKSALKVEKALKGNGRAIIRRTTTGEKAVR
jgi:hypothetical protein